ncbi:MAG: hypothetical protein A2Z34_07580 [Planctomycetes bacterium RBG_16_59_8]|nr:MAG: hypothetical protein A2Z34_07580 [Planctomycetes bacterium RBG_16_59_8]
MGLFSNTDDFFGFFEQSSRNIVEGARLLNEMMKNYDRALDYKVKIKDLEHKTDDITHTTFTRLDSTFITPIDREDIHTLTSTLDDVMDFIDGAASRLILYRIEAPTPGLVALSAILNKGANKVHSAICMFRTFKKSKEALFAELVEINTIENEGDDAMRTAMTALFDQEKDAIKVIKLKEIYEHIETAIDRCEDVANAIEETVLKNS